MSPLIRLLRTLANALGLALWARVQTSNPDVTYWFGPFISRQSLSSSLPHFLDDLSQEHPGAISHSVLRSRRAEPLTISSEG